MPTSAPASAPSAPAVPPPSARGERFWGLALIAAGIAALSLPLAAGLGVAILCGWLIGVAGIVQLLAAWSRRHHGAAVWQVLLGLLYIVAAIWLLREPGSGLASLTLVVAALLIAEAVWQLLWWLRLRRTAGAWVLLINAVVSLLLGVLILASWPFSAIWVVGSLLGVGLIVAGSSRLLHLRLGQLPVPVAAPLP